MKEICIDCEKEAVYVRHTQFAGSHPMCEQHAKEDPEFMLGTSYQCWEKL